MTEQTSTYLAERLPSLPRHDEKYCNTRLDASLLNNFDRRLSQWVSALLKLLE